MVQDDHYDGAAQLLTNAVTPSAVSTVLMNDLLNRANTLKLPMLLAVAQNTDHPLKDQAREMLELLLQQDNGSNWDQWSAAIDTWLQNNPQKGRWLQQLHQLFTGALALVSHSID